MYESENIVNKTC